MTDTIPDVSIAQFLEDNSSLFTILSVFGAISIYFARFPSSSNSYWQNVGTVSSLLLFLVTAFAIRSRLKTVVDGQLFDYLIKPRQASYKLVLFVIPLYLLTLAVATLVVEYSVAATFVLQLILVFVGMSTVVWIIGAYESVLGQEDLGTLGRDPWVLTYCKHMAALTIVGLLGSAFFLWRLTTAYDYGISSVVLFQAGPGVVPILFGYGAGIFAGSILYLTLAGLISVLHFMIQWLEQRGMLETYGRFYRKWQSDSTAESEQTRLKDY